MTAGETGAHDDEGGDHLDDVFALLGNETRMGILRELWDVREPFLPTAENALSFTDLRERVGVSDPGQFNYHLSQLVGTFLARTEEGYVLPPNAVNMLRAAIVRSGIEDVSLTPTPAEDPCPLCGGGVEVLYADDRLVVRCTACPGEYESEVSPKGTLIASQTFPKPGVGGKDGQELWQATIDHSAIAAFGFLRGLCPECAVRPSVSTSVCTDHATDGICEACGSTQAALATVHCENCNFAWRVPAWIPAMIHPEVIGFFHDHGLDVDGGLTLDAYNAFLNAQESVRAVEPLRLEETIELDADELTVVVDDSLTVVDVRT